MNQVFVRSDQLSDIIYDIKLYLPEWKVLFALDGKMDSTEISRFLEIDQNEVENALSRLQELNLVASESGQKVEPEAAPAEEPAESDITEEDFKIEEEGEPESQPQPEVQEEMPEEFASPEEEPETPEEEPLEKTFTFSPEEGASEGETEAEEEAEEGFDILGLSGQEAGKEESEEDLDRLINDLLQEETDDAGTTDFEIPDESLENMTEEEVEEEELTEESEEKDEFDLGDIFQTEMSETEQSLDEMLETAEAEEEVEEEEAGADFEAAPAAEGVERKTILVVDDSVVIRKMVEIALENENYEIVTVANGKDALSYLDNKEPNLVILDIMLPDVNGLDILKAIKASKTTPVVMLSAKDTPKETSKAKELGADDFIPKPFKDEELVDKIHELIGE